MSLSRYKEQYDYDLPTTQFSSWYKARPYCFRVTTRDGGKFSFYLPINPTNLNITTHFATNIIATAYGTVEEHSEQRYFDIVISGTTGMAPKNVDIQVDKNGGVSSIRKPAESFWDTIKNMSKQVLLSNSASGAQGRQSYSSTGINTGGFFNRTKALVNNTINKAVDVFGSSDTDYAGAITNSKSGYVAFHNFYRFLLAHKKEILGKRGNERWSGKHPIQFINYKDNNQYNVVVQNFQLLRSVEDPMLYKYNIVMRGYKLSNPDSTDATSEDDKIKSLGLDGVKSITARALLSNGARNAKNAVASAVGAVKGFGS